MNEVNPWTAIHFLSLPPTPSVAAAMGKKHNNAVNPFGGAPSQAKGGNPLNPLYSAEDNDVAKHGNKVREKCGS